MLINEAGKWADLSIIKGNPLDDITRTRTVHTVMKAGTIYDSATLLKSVEGKMGPANAEEARAWQGAGRWRVQAFGNVA